MRLFVLGATGRTGVELLDLALARHHQVTAFVRSPEKIVRRSPELAIVKGNVFDAEEIAAALAGHDAVISALGPRAGQVIRGMTLMKDSAASVLQGMKAARVERFLVVSAALLFPGGGLGVGLFRSLIGRHVWDLQRMEGLVKQTPLQWTIARPPRLVHGRNAGYRAQESSLAEPLSARSTMSWRSVAAFLLDATESNLYARKVVGLAGGRP
jgi:putative NADH-flavin reductase